MDFLSSRRKPGDLSSAFSCVERTGDLLIVIAI